jgi:putative ABC transport system substrate-binding protein
VKSLARLAAILVTLLLSTSVAAQTPARTVRIGLLDYGAPSASGEARWEALRERLRELGYAEGRNASFEVRWADGHSDRLSSLAAEMVGHKVDVIVTVTIEAARAVKQVTRTIPIVTATGGDPVVAGLAASLARPGGNVTGVTSLNRNLNGKRLELVKELLPHATRVAMVRDPDNRTSGSTLKNAESLARSLGLAVQSFDVRAGEFQPVFAAMQQAHVQAVIMADNTPFLGERRRLADVAIAHRLPVIAAAREYTEAGALMSYGTDYPDLFRRAAEYVDRILRGAKPGDLPIEQPTKFELVINLKTSRALGLTIPPQILARADEVIEPR